MTFFAFDYFSLCRRCQWVCSQCLKSKLQHYILQIMTATVETVAEQLDLAAIMPAEKVVTAVARSVTLSETDVGM